MRPFEIISWHGPERSGGSAAGLLLEGLLGGPEELAHHELGGAADEPLAYAGYDACYRGLAHGIQAGSVWGRR